MTCVRYYESKIYRTHIEHISKKRYRNAIDMPLNKCQTKIKLQNNMTKKSNNMSISIDGKVGTLTGYMRNDKHYFRSATTSAKVSHSSSQLKQRSKFRVATQAFSRLSPAFKIGFCCQRASGQTGYNAGMSYNIQSAIDSTENGYEVNWAAVKLSLGGLPNVENPTMECNVDGELIVKWDANNQSGNAKAGDLMVFAFYDIEQPLLWMLMPKGITRSLGEFRWKIPEECKQKIVLGYVFTKQQHSDLTSASEFLGKMPTN